MTIAIDFDGTCVTHEYPRIGRDIGAVPVLREIVQAGHRLVLNTMRSGAGLREAAAWFERNNIPLYGINENPDQKSWTDSPKVYAHVYIDDAAFGCPLKYDAGLSSRPFVDWEMINLGRLLRPEEEIVREGGKEMTEREKVYSLNEEDWTEEMSEILDELMVELETEDERELIGKEYFEGERVPIDMRRMVSIDAITDALNEKAYDIGGEDVDDWPGLTAEEKTELRDMIAGFLERHHVLKFYGVENVVKKTITADDVKDA
ncbi:MAG: hypothetical protein LBP23_05010 [Treponema sp.]|jgi:hypothetical protein|nr:hypothetical protein [Treponema sp.]